MFLRETDAVIYDVLNFKCKCPVVEAFAIRIIAHLHMKSLKKSSSLVAFIELCACLLSILCTYTEDMLFTINFKQALGQSNFQSESDHLWQKTS